MSFMLLINMIAASTALLVGLDTGMIAISLNKIHEQMQLSEFLKGSVVGLTLCGALLGSISSGTIVNRYGRVVVLKIAVFLFILGCLIKDFAPQIYWLL